MLRLHWQLKRKEVEAVGNVPLNAGLGRCGRIRFFWGEVFLVDQMYNIRCCFICYQYVA